MTALSPHVTRQIETLGLMNALRAEKSEGMTIHIVDKFPPLESLESLTYLGSFSWTSQAIKTKWIKRKYAYDIGAGWVTPADIARDYLAVKFGGKRQRCNKRQWEEVVRVRKHQPLFAEPCSLTSAYYIDLKSAYWQLMMLGGWDVEYSPKRFLSPRSDVYDFPVPEIKLARNSLVSMGLPSGANVWLPNVGFTQKKPFKPTVNLILWGFVQDTLHGLAYDMVQQAGAVYVNTDGYIIPAERLRDADKIAENWGLHFTIRDEGKAEVRGAGDYDIGGRMSRRVRTVPRAFSYIQPREIDWLRSKVKFFSKRIDMSLKNPPVEELLLTNVAKSTIL